MLAGAAALLFISLGQPRLQRHLQAASHPSPNQLKTRRSHSCHHNAHCSHTYGLGRPLDPIGFGQVTRHPCPRSARVLQSACNSGRVFHSVLPPIAIVTARIDCSQDFRRTVSGTEGGGLSSATMSASLEAVKLLQKSDCPNLSMSTTWSNTQLPVLSWGSRRRQSAARVLRSRLSIFMQQLQGCWIKQTKGKSTGSRANLRIKTNSNASRAAERAYTNDSAE